MVWYYPSRTNPLTDSSISLPYKFAGGWNDTLSTTSTESIQDAQSFFINIIYYITPYYQQYQTSKCDYYKIKFNNKECVIAINAIVTVDGSQLLTWIEDGLLKVKFTPADFYEYLILPPRIHINDFNNDGFMDSLIMNVSSNYYPETFIDGVTFVSGKTQNSFFFHNPYFSNKETSFINFIEIDKELQSENNKPILKIIQDSVIYMEYADMDPTLDYYIRFLHEDYLKVDSPFSSSKTVRPKWYPMPIELPKHYNIWIEFDSTNVFYSSKPGDKGWLFYYGSYHLSRYAENNPSSRVERINNKTTYIVKNDIYKIYKTGHGIIAQKGNKYAWVFHADNIWRVRTPSIYYVCLYKQYIICFVNDFESGTNYMINIETGEQKTISISIDYRIKVLMEQLIKDFEK